MSIIRLILATLVSIGLVLSPVAAANTMAAMPAALLDAGGPATTSSMDKACPCCDSVAKCTMAICTMSCVQFGPASDAVFPVALIGHAALSGIVPLMHYGVGWPPPTPPPRV